MTVGWGLGGGSGWTWTVRVGGKAPVGRKGLTTTKVYVKRKTVPVKSSKEK